MKDRSMICRMAGNIAAGVIAEPSDEGEPSWDLRKPTQVEFVAKAAVGVALAIIAEVDRKLATPPGGDER